jgi:primosomal protein N' (replication factor Y)
MTIEPPAHAPSRRIVRIAVPKPLRALYDYTVPEHLPLPPPGSRVRVPFGPRSSVGVCVEHATTTARGDDLKPITALLDPTPVLDSALLALLRWASDYYQHPIGDALFAALPAGLREGERVESLYDVVWCRTDMAEAAPARAPRQRALLDFLARRGGRATRAEVVTAGFDTRVLTALATRGAVRADGALPEYPLERRPSGLNLNADQARAVATVRSVIDRYEVHLLHGVTGSGKTEVYLSLIDSVLDLGRQALILIPEIALTPQTLRRFEARFGTAAVYHSALGDRERGQTWEACRTGAARVLIGTRSAVFVPFARLGIIVVDEEHDGSFKQQEGFRYSARDLAVVRGRNAGIPVVFGTATPALETLHNAAQGRYRHLRLAARTGAAVEPKLSLVDLRGQSLTEGMSAALIEALRSHLDAGNQGLVFINRRGYAPSYLCTRCGWCAECERCAVRLTLHLRPLVLRCHHCGQETVPPASCPDCGSDALRPVGFGTQRTEQALLAHFPGVPVIRIDRDTVRTPARLAERLGRIDRGEPALLVGTQMLAKGHHFPRVTLVGVLNADGGFASADFRAPEHTAQLIIQVAGRAGRAEWPGEVLIQTYDPDNPSLRALIAHGYDGFAEDELARRAAAGLPPYRALALLRADGSTLEAAMAQLHALVTPLHGDPRLDVWGPAPAPMARRADRFRAQCALVAEDRRELSRFLARVVEAGRDLRTRDVRWSIDVDPYDLI